MRALIVDASKAMRLILGRIMGELGFGVVEAPNGRRALEQLVAGLFTRSAVGEKQALLQLLPG